MANDFNQADVEKLKEFMFRSSEQLNYLTKKVDTVDAKVNLVITDVQKIKLDMENHPILCPLNPPEILSIVRQELSKLPEQRLTNAVKFASILSTMAAIAAIIIALLK